MNNYKLLIQYDGSRYKGWQRLGNTENTIQFKIEYVLCELVGSKIEITGSSRTDAGVHALAQTANFKTDKKLTETEIMSYLNSHLPQDISIIDVKTVPEQFHARFNAKTKVYLYKIWNKEYSHPFMRKYSMHIPYKLHIDSMKIAAQYFIGSHDFTTFSNTRSKTKSMVRTVYSIDIEEQSGFIYIRIRGDGFLHNMVRKIVGMLISVGVGEENPDIIPEIIDTKQRNRVNKLADACGLFLEDIEF